MILNLQDSKSNIRNALSVDCKLHKYNRGEIFRLLVDAINSDRLPPGNRLPQEYLAGIFGVSRMPVREAMRQLERLGLIVSTRFYGTIVSGHLYDEAAEAHAIRMILEPHILEIIVDRGNLLPEEVFLGKIFFDDCDPRCAISTYRYFCISLYKLSDIPYLHAIALEELEKSLIFLERYLLVEENISRVESSIHELINNMKRKDKKNAIEHWKSHLLSISETQF